MPRSRRNSRGTHRGADPTATRQEDSRPMSRICWSAMTYFSDREKGPAPRTIEEITPEAWRGIWALILRKRIPGPVPGRLRSRWVTTRAYSKRRCRATGSCSRSPWFSTARLSLTGLICKALISVPHRPLGHPSAIDMSPEVARLYQSETNSRTSVPSRVRWFTKPLPMNRRPDSKLVIA